MNLRYIFSTLFILNTTINNHPNPFENFPTFVSTKSFANFTAEKNAHLYFPLFTP